MTQIEMKKHNMMIGMIHISKSCEILANGAKPRGRKRRKKYTNR